MLAMVEEGDCTAIWHETRCSVLVHSLLIRSDIRVHDRRQRILSEMAEGEVESRVTIALSDR